MAVVEEVEGRFEYCLQSKAAVEVVEEGALECLEEYLRNNFVAVVEVVAEGALERLEHCLQSMIVVEVVVEEVPYWLYQQGC